MPPFSAGDKPSMRILHPQRYVVIIILYNILNQSDDAYHALWPPRWTSKLAFITGQRDFPKHNEEQKL